MKSLLLITLLLFFSSFELAFSWSDAQFQATCVDQHNNWRSQVAKGEIGNEPSGSDIRKMEWNSALAAVAQDWNDELCKTPGSLHHNQNTQSEALTKGYTSAGSEFASWREFSVGENLAASYFHGDDSLDKVKNMINGWFEEHSLYTFSECCGGNFGDYGHYTQGVWATSYRLGCAHLKCSNSLWRVLTCNYGVAGNYPEFPYNSGSYCSACPNGWTNCDNGLCSKVASSPTKKPIKSPTQRPIKSPTKKPTKRPTRRPSSRPTTPHPTNSGPLPTKKPTQRPITPPSPTRKPTTRSPTPSNQACTSGCLYGTARLSIRSQNGDTCNEWASAFHNIPSIGSIIPYSRLSSCEIIPNYFGNGVDGLKMTWILTMNEWNAIWSWINNNDWSAALVAQMNLLRGTSSYSNGAEESQYEKDISGEPLKSNDGKGGSNNTPLIVGLVIGAACLFGLLIGSVYWCQKNKRQDQAYVALQNEQQAKPLSTYAPPNQP